MKISTMRLPTGEFILVLSGAKYHPSDPETFKTLRERTGAAAVFATDEDVEVEDAVVDADCRRADYRTPYQQAEDLAGPTFTSVYFPNLQVESIGELVNGQVEFTATALTAQDSLHFDLGPLSTEDIAITRAIMEGQEFSPAGLVIGDHRLLHGTPPAEEQGTPGADPEPDGEFNADIAEPLGQAIEDDEDSYDEPIGLPEPRPFVGGDRVVVNGTSWLNTTVYDFIGTVEEVPESHRRTLEASTHRDGYTVRVREEDGAGRTMYFRPEDVKHYDMVED